ncbi:MAG: hypothetical protein AAFX81_12565 [Pseudomonadota bacterium]
MIEESFRRANDLAEDLHYLREIANNNNVERRNLRHASVVLRRMLVEDELKRVGAPRIGCLEVRAHQLNEVYRACKKQNYYYYANLGAKVCGVYLKGISAATQPASARPTENGALDGSQDRFVDLSIDSFKKQKIFFLRDTWVTRIDVIKHIANKGGGAHPSNPRSGGFDDFLDEVRSFLMIHNIDGVPSIGFNVNNTRSSHEIGFGYGSDLFDPFLVEILATACQLTLSPKIIELEQVIKIEIERRNKNRPWHKNLRDRALPEKDV